MEPWQTTRRTSVTDEQHPRGAEGQSPSSKEDLAPRGEELASGELPDTEPYVVDDEEAEELQGSSDAPDSTPDKGDPQDVVIDDADQLADAEKAASRARSSRPRRKAKTKLAGAEKSTAAVATVSEEDGADGDEEAGEAYVPRREITRAPVRRKKVAETGDGQEHKRANPVKFTKQSVGELKKVRWPTGQETGQYFLVVLVFVLLIIAVVGGLDAFFAWGLLKTLG